MIKTEVTVITMRKQIAIYFEVSGYFASRYSGHYVYPAEQYTKANAEIKRFKQKGATVNYYNRQYKVF